MELSCTQTAKLVLGYLKSENCIKAHHEFLRSCRHLKDVRNKPGKTIVTRVLGMNLIEILMDYAKIYTIIQEKLEDTDFFNDRNRSNNLSHQLRYLLDDHIPSRCSTPNFMSRCSTPTPQRPTDTNATQLKNLPGNLNTEPKNKPHQPSSSNETESDSVEDNDGRKNESAHMAIQAFAQSLLDQHELTKKLAENINEVIENKENTKDGAAFDDIDSAIKAVLDKTESDPAFDTLMGEVIGSVSTMQNPEVAAPDKAQPFLPNYFSTAEPNKIQPPLYQPLNIDTNLEIQKNTINSNSGDITIYDGSIESYIKTGLIKTQTQSEKGSVMLIAKQSDLSEQDILQMPTVIIADDGEVKRKKKVKMMTPRPPEVITLYKCVDGVNHKQGLKTLPPKKKAKEAVKYEIHVPIENRNPTSADNIIATASYPNGFLNEIPETEVNSIKVSTLKSYSNPNLGKNRDIPHVSFDLDITQNQLHGERIQGGKLLAKNEKQFAINKQFEVVRGKEIGSNDGEKPTAGNLICDRNNEITINSGELKNITTTDSMNSVPTNQSENNNVAFTYNPNQCKNNSESTPIDKNCPNKQQLNENKINQEVQHSETDFTKKNPNVQNGLLPQNPDVLMENVEKTISKEKKIVLLQNQQLFPGRRVQQDQENVVAGERNAIPSHNQENVAGDKKIISSQNQEKIDSEVGRINKTDKDASTGGNKTNNNNAGLNKNEKRLQSIQNQTDLLKSIQAQSENLLVGKEGSSTAINHTENVLGGNESSLIKENEDSALVINYDESQLEKNGGSTLVANYDENLLISKNEDTSLVKNYSDNLLERNGAKKNEISPLTKNSWENAFENNKDPKNESSPSGKKDSNEVSKKASNRKVTITDVIDEKKIVMEKKQVTPGDKVEQRKTSSTPRSGNKSHVRALDFKFNTPPSKDAFGDPKPKSVSPSKKKSPSKAKTAKSLFKSPTKTNLIVKKKELVKPKKLGSSWDADLRITLSQDPSLKSPPGKPKPKPKPKKQVNKKTKKADPKTDEVEEAKPGKRQTRRKSMKSPQKVITVTTDSKYECVSIVESEGKVEDVLKSNENSQITLINCNAKPRYNRKCNIKNLTSGGVKGNVIAEEEEEVESIEAGEEEQVMGANKDEVCDKELEVNQEQSEVNEKKLEVNNKNVEGEKQTKINDFASKQIEVNEATPTSDKIVKPAIFDMEDLIKIDCRDGESKFLTPELIRAKAAETLGAGIKNITPILETPVKDFYPKTPCVVSPATVEDTPFTKVFKDQFSNIDLTSIQTPKFLATPNFPFTPLLDGQSPHSNRGTDYSTSSSYYQPSDTEQNKCLEMFIKEECKRPPPRRITPIKVDEPMELETKVLENQIQVNTKEAPEKNVLAEKMKQFSGSLIARKNLSLMPRKVGSSDESNSEESYTSDTSETSETSSCEGDSVIQLDNSTMQYSLRSNKGNSSKGLSEPPQEDIKSILGVSDFKPVLPESKISKEEERKRQVLSELEIKRRRTVEALKGNSVETTQRKRAAPKPKKTPVKKNQPARRNLRSNNKTQSEISPNRKLQTIMDMEMSSSDEDELRPLQVVETEMLSSKSNTPVPENTPPEMPQKKKDPRGRKSKKFLEAQKNKNLQNNEKDKLPSTNEKNKNNQTSIIEKNQNVKEVKSSSINEKNLNKDTNEKNKNLKEDKLSSTNEKTKNLKENKSSLTSEKNEDKLSSLDEKIKNLKEERLSSTNEKNLKEDKLSSTNEKNKSQLGNKQNLSSNCSEGKNTNVSQGLNEHPQEKDKNLQASSSYCTQEKIGNTSEDKPGLLDQRSQEKNKNKVVSNDKNNALSNEKNKVIAGEDTQKTSRNLSGNKQASSGYCSQEKSENTSEYNPRNKIQSQNCHAREKDQIPSLNNHYSIQEKNQNKDCHFMDKKTSDSSNPHISEERKRRLSKDDPALLDSYSQMKNKNSVQKIIPASSDCSSGDRNKQRRNSTEGNKRQSRDSEAHSQERNKQQSQDYPAYSQEGNKIHPASSDYDSRKTSEENAGLSQKNKNVLKNGNFIQDNSTLLERSKKGKNEKEDEPKKVTSRGRRASTKKSAEVMTSVVDNESYDGKQSQARINREETQRRINSEERVAKINSRETQARINSEETQGKINDEERFNNREAQGRINDEERLGRIKDEERLARINSKETQGKISHEEKLAQGKKNNEERLAKINDRETQSRINNREKQAQINSKEMQAMNNDRETLVKITNKEKQALINYKESLNNREAQSQSNNKAQTINRETQSQINDKAQVNNKQSKAQISNKESQSQINNKESQINKAEIASKELQAQSLVEDLKERGIFLKPNKEKRSQKEMEEGEILSEDESYSRRMQNTCERKMEELFGEETKSSDVGKTRREADSTHDVVKKITKITDIAKKSMVKKGRGNDGAKNRNSRKDEVKSNKEVEIRKKPERRESGDFERDIRKNARNEKNESAFREQQIVSEAVSKDSLKNEEQFLKKQTEVKEAEKVLNNLTKESKFDSVDTSLGEHMEFDFEIITDVIEIVYDENAPHNRIITNQEHLRRKREVEIYIEALDTNITRPIVVEVNDNIFSYRPPQKRRAAFHVIEDITISNRRQRKVEKSDALCIPEDKECKTDDARNKVESVRERSGSPEEEECREAAGSHLSLCRLNEKTPIPDREYDDLMNFSIVLSGKKRRPETDIDHDSKKPKPEHPLGIFKKRNIDELLNMIHNKPDE